MIRAMSKPRLLIVDDDPAICDFLRTVATELDMDVVDATMASEALGIVDSFKPNIIILDLCMPDMDAVKVIAKVTEKHCDASIRAGRWNGSANAKLSAGTRKRA